jgi:hypothetical protein
MSTIHIRETFEDDVSVVVRIDGILDADSIPIVEEVCHRHLGRGRRVLLEVEGLLHISREGREFLRQIQDEVVIENAPQFVRLEGRE